MGKQRIRVRNQRCNCCNSCIYKVPLIKESIINQLPGSHSATMPLSSIALLLTFVASLVDQVIDSTPLAELTACALTLFVVLEWRATAIIGKAMVAIVVIIAAVSYFQWNVSGEVLLEAMRRAGFFVALFVGIGLLREAAEMSPAIQRCGEYLVAQPPSRRYLALALSSHIFSIVLSIGTLPLLAGIINKNNALNAAKGNLEVWNIRQRRMAMAIMRGFNTTVFWSPFSLALIVTNTSLNAGNLNDFYLIGFISGLIILLWGWVLDRFSVPQSLRLNVDPIDTTQRWPVLLNLVGLVLVVYFISLITAHLLHSSLLLGMLISVPFVCAVCIMFYVDASSFAERLQQTLQVLKQHATEQFPTYRSEASMVGTAGALGVLLSVIAPKEALAELLTSLHLSGLPLALLIVVTVILAGQLALVPLVSVTILASLLPPPELINLRYEEVMLAFVGAWAFATQSSIFSGTTLVTARQFNRSATTIAYRWNGSFVLSGIVVLCLILTLVHNYYF